MDPQIIAIPAFKLNQFCCKPCILSKAHIGVRRTCTSVTLADNQSILRSVDEVFSIIGRQRIVIDLVDETIDFLLDEPAVFVGVRIVRRVDRLLLEGL